MLQMIFARRSDGSVAPRTPRNRDGSPRQADGVRTFTLAQAVGAFQMSEAELLALYDEFYGDLFPRLQDGEVGTFDADPAGAATVRRDLLRAVRFPHLSDVEFDAVMSMCADRQLDPWRHVYAETRVGQNGRRELRTITTIDALRSLADHTGKYKGQDGPYYLDDQGKWHADVWPDKARPPVAAKVGIKRRGFDGPLFAVAEWDAYVQMVETPRGLEVSDIWQVRGAPQLAKCAEALGFRKAFPKALGGLYTVEEMQQANNPRPSGGGGGVAARAPGPRPAQSEDVAITDETPVSWREFEQLLAERFRVTEAEPRRELIMRLRQSIPGAASPVPKMFFAHAIRALEERPGEFGLAA